MSGYERATRVIRLEERQAVIDYLRSLLTSDPSDEAEDHADNVLRAAIYDIQRGAHVVERGARRGEL